MSKKFKEVLGNELKDLGVFVLDNLKKVPKNINQGILALGLLGIIYASNSCPRRIYPDKNHSRYLNGIGIDYKEDVGFLSKKNIMKVKIKGNEYIFEDSKDRTPLEWDTKYFKKSQAILEKVTLNSISGESYEFKLDDISSNKFKGNYALKILAKSDSIYNSLRDFISKKFRKEYANDMINLKKGFDYNPNKDTTFNSF